MAEHEYRIVLPLQDNSGQPIRTEVIEALAARMSGWFGGVTVYPAAGCYEADQMLQCEPNVVLAAATLENGPEEYRHSEAANRAFMAQLAEDVGREFGQQEVWHEEATEDVSEWVRGTRQEHLPGYMLDLRLPRIPRDEAFRAILPGRWRAS